MSNELKVIPRPDVYNVYLVTCIRNAGRMHLELEMDISVEHELGKKISIRDESDPKGYKYAGLIESVYYDLYKHRLSDTHVRWKLRQVYVIKEIKCQEVKEEESMVVESKTQ